MWGKNPDPSIINMRQRTDLDVVCSKLFLIIIANVGIYIIIVGKNKTEIYRRAARTMNFFKILLLLPVTAISTFLVRIESTDHLNI